MIASLLRYRARRVAQVLSEHIEPMSSVLDLGCGDGLVSCYLQRKISIKAQGADVVLQKKRHIPVVRYDGTRLPFRTGEFDSVMLIWVLHHTTEQESVLREAARVTSGDILVAEAFFRTSAQERLLHAIDYLENKPWGVPVPFCCHTQQGWERVFNKAGFRVIEKGKLKASRLDPTSSMLYRLRHETS